jgi:class II flagellar assembly regulator FliX
MRAPIIERARQAEASRRKPPARGAGEPRFAQHLRTGQPSPAEPAQASAAAAPLAAVLDAPAIGEIGEPGEPRATRYASDLLDRLDALRLDLLDGRIDGERLDGLCRTLRAERLRCNDTRLESVVEEIELRAQVELAKLARSV